MIIKKLNSLNDLENTEFKIIDELKPIKNNLKQILIKRKLSQSDLAKSTGISKQLLSAIINDKIVPGLVVSSKIAFVLKLNILDIFELTEDNLFNLAKTNSGQTIYIDLATNEIIDSTEKRKRKDYIFKNTLNNIYINKENYNKEIKKENFVKINRFKKLVQKHDLLYLNEKKI